MNNRDITFVLKVQNDAKAGLQSLGVDFQKVVDKINTVGDKSGASARRGAEAIKAQVTGVRELLSVTQKAEMGMVRLARAAAAARANTRIDQARARGVEGATITAADRAAERLQRERIVTQQTLQRELDRTAAAAQRQAQALARRAGRDAQGAQRAQIPIDTAQAAAAQRAARDIAATQIAQSNAALRIRMNELAIEREQLRVERDRLGIAERRLRLENMQAAAKNADLMRARQAATAAQRTLAAEAAAARQRVLLANAQARHGPAGTGHGRTGHPFLNMFSGILGMGGGQRGVTPNVWPGLTGGAGAAAGALGSLRNALRGLGLLYISSQIIEMADIFRTLYARIGLVTDSALQQSAVMERLTDVAQRTRSGLSEVVNVYYGLTRANATLGLSQREMIGITEGISKSIAISGVNAQAASFGLMQLAQAFSSGQLRGDELNSVLEQLPALAQAIAKHVKLATGTIGVAGPGALKTLAEQGKLTVKQVVDAIQESLGEFDEAFKKLPVTFAQGLTVLKNGVMVFIAEINNATGATNGMGKMLARLGSFMSSKEFIAFAADLGNAIARVAGMIGVLVIPMFEFLRKNIATVASELTALAGAFIAFKVLLKILPLISLLASGLRGVAAASVLATGAMGGLKVATMGTTLQLAAFRTGLMALIANPYVAAIVAIGAAIGYIGVKMYQSVKASEDFKDSLASVEEAQKKLAELRAHPEQIQNLDPAFVNSAISNATTVGEQSAPMLAEKQAEVERMKTQIAANLKAAEELRSKWANVSGYSANLARSQADDLTEQATRWTEGLGWMTSELDRFKSSVDSAKDVVTAFNEILNGTLDKKPINVLRFGLTSEEQNKLQGFLEQGNPALKRAKDTFDQNDYVRRLNDDGVRQIMQALEPPPGMNPDGTPAFAGANGKPLGDIVEMRNRLGALAENSNASRNESPTSKLLREMQSEIRILQMETAAGGPLPLERKMLDVRKQAAANMGPLVSAESPAAYAAAEAARPALALEQQLNLTKDLNAAAKEKLDTATREHQTLRLFGADLLREQYITEAIKKARSENAGITDEMAAQYRNNILPAMQEAADAQMAVLVDRSMLDNIYETGTALEQLQGQLAFDPTQLDVLNSTLDLQMQIADRLHVSLAQVQKDWAAITKRAGKSAEQIAADALRVKQVQAQLDVRTNTADKRLELEDEYRLRLLAGDALERQAFLLDQINKLMATGMSRQTAEVYANSQMNTLGFDAAMEQRRLGREDPLQGSLGGMQKGLADWVANGKDLFAQFSEFASNSLTAISDTFVELATTGKANFKEMTAAILRDVAAMIVRFLVLRAVMAAMNMLSSTAPVGGIGAAGAAPTGMSVGMVAQGAAFEAGRKIKAYARGGVVKKPTFFPMANGGTGLMGEAGAEAVMPLRRLANGRLGVESMGGGNNTSVFAPNVTINVENKGNVSGGGDEKFAAQLAAQVDSLMSAKMAQFTQRHTRPGGMLRNSVEV